MSMMCPLIIKYLIGPRNWYVKWLYKRSSLSNFSAPEFLDIFLTWNCFEIFALLESLYQISEAPELIRFIFPFIFGPKRSPTVRYSKWTQSRLHKFLVWSSMFCVFSWCIHKVSVVLLVKKVMDKITIMSVYMCDKVLRDSCNF